MTRYDATAYRDDRWWIVTVPGIGVTQARTLVDAGPMAVDMVALMLAVDPATVSVAVRTELDADATEAVEDLQAMAKERDEANRHYEDARRHAARILREHGISGRDTGTILGGLSKQRVSQLIND